MSEINEKSQLFIPPFSSKVPALFLDRDGVIIEDCHYLSDPCKVRLCLGARELIASACRQGWPVILITNQSGIARGFFGWHHVELVHQRLQELLGEDAQLAAIYANGYGPDAPACTWRKPSPLMLFAAATALNLDLKRSLLIGDRVSDLQAGAAAGMAKLFHVLSGHGRHARASVVEWDEQRRNLRETATTSILHLIDSLDEFPLSHLQRSSCLQK